MVQLQNVINLAVPTINIYAAINKKTHDGSVYIYWLPSDPNAATYAANFILAQNMWNGYKSFDTYLVDIISSDDVATGYVVQEPSSYLSDLYASVVQRMLSPFKFYIPTDSADWKYFNVLWLPLYQRLLTKLTGSNVFVPHLDLSNIALYSGALYSEWLFDIDTADAQRSPAIHPSYEAAIKMFEDDPSSLDTMLTDIAGDIYAGGSTPPF